jgi:hypothetical protein
MPRAIVYGRRDPKIGHYDALVASELGEPGPERQQELHATATDLAGQVIPEAVQPLYLARLAQEPNALLSPDKATWWTEAAQEAASGKVPPQAAVKLTEAAAQGEEPSKDGFLEKIAKYVPAESITLTLLAFAALSPTGSDVWWLVVAGALANVLYLFGTALHARKEAPMPKWYFYPLSAGALVLWAIGVVEVVGHEAGIEGSNAEVQKTFVLAVAAFFVPLLDTIITGLSEIYEERKAHKQG